MAASDGMQDEAVTRSNNNRNTSGAKPRRVRTGCLTCRERHLKCDEGLPTCLNCRKSGRECKRGVRLNFIDTQCEAPPLAAPIEAWNVAFEDESREIASEYQGGLQRYASLEQPVMPPTNDDSMAYEMTNAMPNAPAMQHQALPTMGPSEQANGAHGFFDDGQGQQQQPPHSQQPQSAQLRHESMVLHHHQAYTHTNGEVQQEPGQGPREILDNAEETLYMQVFVEEVGAWMDSMDSMKHFSRVMPFHALREPMLLNAFLACGSRHLTLVNPSTYMKEDNRALEYYDRASRLLLRALQNPNRDSVICATTAVILNVYEIMTEKALPRMNHIAGARALIKECGWSARSTGIGAACFWLNVGLETLSNLRFNWQSSWNPGDWGLDLDLSMETIPGREESWTLRMLYIIAKISDFRATIPKRAEAPPEQEHYRRNQRLHQWYQLKNLADTWEQNGPRTMKPMAYLQPWQNSSRSAFPDIWIIKRTSIVGRLLYHNAMVLLAQINPMATPSGSPFPAPQGVPIPSQADLSSLESYHAHQICGIVAHVKDRGVASIALRCLHHAAECLTVRREQEEVLEILTRIHKDTGWRINFMPEDLMSKWKWSQNELSATLNGMNAPAQAAQPNGHSAQMQAAAAMAAVANAAGGMPNGNGGMMGGFASPPQTGLGLGQPQQSPRYQFDQYAEVQNWKRNQQHQRQASLASQPSQHSPPDMGMNGMGQQQQPQQQQMPQPQHASPPQRAPPQGIVNPMYQQKLPPTWQGYYVSPVQTNDDMEHTRHTHGGLGLSLEAGFVSQAGGY